jgi:hypothetical protein
MMDLTMLSDIFPTGFHGADARLGSGSEAVECPGTVHQHAS